MSDDNETSSSPETEALKQQKLVAEIARIGVETEVKKAELEVLSRRNTEWHSGPDASRIYTFYGGVDRGSVRDCMADLGQWSRRDPGKDIRIVFNSPGGSVLDGLAMFDFILELRTSGHRVETVTLGMAASMGGILLQAGDKRVAGRNAHLLIHEISALNIGKVSEMEDELEFCKRLQDKLITILAERSTLSETQIRRRWKKKDWWLDANEALEYGFVDEIR